MFLNYSSLIIVHEFLFINYYDLQIVHKLLFINYLVLLEKWMGY